MQPCISPHSILAFSASPKQGRSFFPLWPKTLQTREPLATADKSVVHMNSQHPFCFVDLLSSLKHKNCQGPACRNNNPVCPSLAHLTSKTQLLKVECPYFRPCNFLCSISFHKRPPCKWFISCRPWIMEGKNPGYEIEKGQKMSNSLLLKGTSCFLSREQPTFI